MYNIDGSFAESSSTEESAVSLPLSHNYYLLSFFFNFLFTVMTHVTLFYADMPVAYENVFRLFFLIPPFDT